MMQMFLEKLTFTQLINKFSTFMELTPWCSVL